jgi:hypothetical protein
MPALPTAQMFGRGLAFADLDGDRDPDVVATGHSSGRIGIFENLGDGSFVERLATGAPLAPNASGVTAADYDGDGDLDLYVSCWLTANLLLRNDGGFTFTDCAAAAEVDDLGAGAGSAWADVDGDGWLDLYLANRTGTNGSVLPNRLYRNLGGGVFEEMGTELGVEDGQSPTFQALFFDYDRDADADLYLSTDKGYSLGETNRLFENRSGVLTDVTDDTGTTAGIDSMGVAVGDLDGNGWPDLYCTNTPPGNVLLLNPGTMPFFDETVEAGVQSFALGWGTEMLDYDHDGHLELYVCNVGAWNRLYDHDGTWPALEMAEPLGLHGAGDSYAVAAADVDLDGDLDLLVGLTDHLQLYINHEGERRSWVKLDVVGPWPNRYAIGATVAILTGQVWQTRHVAAGGSYKSQNELLLHFGLGQAGGVDAVQVVWPGGDTRMLANLPAYRTWRLYHPDLLLDADQDGDRDLADFQAFVACYGEGPPGNLVAGCEMMDGDGDGDLDLDDLTLLIDAFDTTVHDCDGNGDPDLLDILLGTDDANGNGIPDACELEGDLDGNGVVNVNDLLAVLTAWGPCPAVPRPCFGDADGNGVVDVDDLLIVVLHWP